MKTKHTFYFLLILTGALLMASEDMIMRKEYAFSLGIILLMYGVYATSRSWNRSTGEEDDKGVKGE